MPDLFRSNSCFRWLDLLKRVSEWMGDCFAEKYLIDSEGDILDEDYAKVYKKDILNQDRWKSLWTDTTDKKCLAHAIVYQLLQKVKIIRSRNDLTFVILIASLVLENMTSYWCLVLSLSTAEIARKF